MRFTDEGLHAWAFLSSIKLDIWHKIVSVIVSAADWLFLLMLIFNVAGWVRILGEKWAAYPAVRAGMMAAKSSACHNQLQNWVCEYLVQFLLEKGCYHGASLEAECCFSKSFGINSFITCNPDLNVEWLWTTCTCNNSHYYLVIKSWQVERTILFLSRQKCMYPL